jgi:hypothetical protein
MSIADLFGSRIIVGASSGLELIGNYTDNWWGDSDTELDVTVEEYDAEKTIIIPTNSDGLSVYQDSVSDAFDTYNPTAQQAFALHTKYDSTTIRLERNSAVSGSGNKQYKNDFALVAVKNVKSIQDIEISLGSSGGSASITEVDLTKSFIVPCGVKSSKASVSFASNAASLPVGIYPYFSSSTGIGVKSPFNSNSSGHVIALQIVEMP